MSANDSEFTGNSATGTIADGGGIFNDDGGHVILTGSTAGASLTLINLDDSDQ